MPSTSGPASTHARSSSCRAGLSFPGRPGRGRSRSPARPSALKRTTASRSDWRSRPTRRAASAQLAPSNACAIASARKAAQRSASPCANRRKSAAPTSSRITKPRAPIRLPPRTRRKEITLQPRHGSHQSQRLWQLVLYNSRLRSRFARLAMFVSMANCMESSAAVITVSSNARYSGTVGCMVPRAVQRLRMAVSESRFLMPARAAR